MADDSSEFVWMREEASKALSFEQLVSAISRTENLKWQLSVGSFYTASVLARQIAERTLSTICEKLRRDPSILPKIRIVDPFVGSGVFLVEAFHVLVENLSPPATREQKLIIVTRCLRGYDIDKRALCMTEALLAFLSEDVSVRLVGSTLIERDMIGNDCSALVGKYHAVITNPPWVLLQKTQTKSELVHSSFLKLETMKRRINLYQIGLHLSLQLLKSSGSIGIVLPSSFCTEPHKQAMREHLLSELNKELSLYYFSTDKCEIVFPGLKLEFIVLIGRKTASLQQTIQTVNIFPRPLLECLENEQGYALGLEKVKELAMFPLDYDHPAAIKTLEGDGPLFSSMYKAKQGKMVYLPQKNTLLDLVPQWEEGRYRFVFSRDILPFRLDNFSLREYDCPRHPSKGIMWINPNPTDTTVRFPFCGNETHAKEASACSYRSLESIPDVECTLMWRRVRTRKLLLNSSGQKSKYAARWIVAHLSQDPICIGDSVQSIKPESPEQGFFLLGVFNSMVFSLAFKLLSVTATISSSVLNKVRIPSRDPEASEDQVDWEEHFPKNCTNLLVCHDVIFSLPFSRGEQTYRTIGSLARKLTERVWEKERKLAWDIPSCSEEILLNHLVARWFGLDQREYQTCLDTIKGEENPKVVAKRIREPFSKGKNSGKRTKK